MEIMKLLPAGKDYLWGGTRLREEFNKRINMNPLAETWECSVHSDGPSIVANGKYSGRMLAEVLDENQGYLGNKVFANADGKKELPVLVKFIDAEKDLSVQVHPDDDYARKYEGQNGKSEMWYIMDARENASIIYGFAHPVTKNLLKDSIEDGSLDKHLQRIKVEKGDVFYVPAGTVHGIGAGTLVAEIQENSNVTYRLFDYDRVDKFGNKRKLHFDKAVAVMDMGVASNVMRKPRLIHYYPGCSRETLCRCKYFETELIRVTHGFSFSVKEESFQIILCLSGESGIETDAGHPLRFRKGDCLFLPAGIGRCYVIGKTEMLKIRC